MGYTKRKKLVETPRGYIIKTGDKGSARLYWSKDFVYERNEEFNKAQAVIDSQMLLVMSPYTPFDKGVLEKSAILGTYIGSGEIVYLAPYSRRLYYNPQYNFQGAPMRGAYWFERAKNIHWQMILRKAGKELK